MLDLLVIVTVTDPAQVGTVADAFAKMRPLCLAEPGCVSWDAYHSREDPSKFVLVERWESEELWRAHGELSAIQDVYLPVVLPRVTREVHPSTRLAD